APGRPDGARLRAHVRPCARARGVRRPAGREADDPELDRRVGGRHPGLPADDAAGGPAARRGRGGAGRDLGRQVLRRASARRGARPCDPGARWARPHRGHAARADVAAGAGGADLRRAGRGAQGRRRPPHPAYVRRGGRMALHVVLEGRRVRLEPLEPRHEEELWTVAQDPRTWRWMRFNGYERDEFRRFWDSVDMGFAHYLDDERRDSAWYAVIDDDWPEAKASLERRLGWRE